MENYSFLSLEKLCILFAKPICLLLFCSYACIHIVAQTQQERIVNGVVETCDMAQSEKILLYNYTTVESRESMTALRSTSEPTRYEVLFPDYPENDDEISSMLQFKKWLHVSLGNIPNIARSLSGKTLSISFYRKVKGIDTYNFHIFHVKKLGL